MQRFLQRSDYRPVIKDEYLAQIISEDEATRYLAEDAAIQEMKPYLSAYDTDALFSASNRNPLLVMFCVDIALYHLMASIAHPRLNDANGLRSKRYERAIKWLEQVKKGDIQPQELTPNPDPTLNHNGKIHISSNPKRQHHFLSLYASHKKSHRNRPKIRI